MNYLLLPIHINAWLTDTSTSIPAPMADFSLLPYHDGQVARNAENSFTGDSISTPPFSNKKMQMRAGLHLHWALPNALTQILTLPDGTSNYPAVPDRWLIIKEVNGQTSQYIVESSYLYPKGQYDVKAITMPYFQDATQPFRYMGKTSLLSNWQAAESSSYYPNLSAVGYGEATFAAYFPNCLSVFGFYDGEANSENLSNATYTLIGYNQQSNTDELYEFVQNYFSLYPSATDNQLLAAIEAFFQCSISNDSAQLPNYLLCCGRLVFPQNIENTSPPELTANNEAISLGNTGTEAMAAYLAANIDSNYQNIIENQIIATQGLDILQSNNIDAGAKFEEMRHNQNFNAIEGGIRWVINKENINQNIANADSSKDAAKVFLPENLGNLLNHLNELQGQYNKALYYVLDSQRQIFYDWYKYIKASYPLLEEAAYLPNINLISWFIQHQSLPEYHVLLKNTGLFTVNKDESTHNVKAVLQQGDKESIAYRLVLAINALSERIATINSDSITVTNNVKFTLATTDAPRYWQPTEPSVLITGDIATSTDRYNRDGIVPAYIQSFDNLINTNPVNINNAVLTTLDNLFQNDIFPYQTYSPSTWNPFMLEWLVAVYPTDKNNRLMYDTTYPSTYITQNFSLDGNAEDLTLQSGRGGVSPKPLLYSGQSILTEYSGDLLYERIYDALYEEVMPDYFEANTIVADRGYLSQTGNIDLVQAWYETVYSESLTTASEKANDPYYNMIRAFSLLQNTQYLSQSLSGFNAALLQLKSTLQLPPQEPLGFPSAQQFTQTVASAVDTQNAFAPMPLNPFLPIRSGGFQLRALKIVDTFGRYKELNLNVNILTTENMQLNAQRLFHLQPRLAQPTRLLFRWLAANDKVAEMNDVPDTQAICGWFLLNHLDMSLMVYNASGKALGEMYATETEVKWLPSPISESAIYNIENIENQYLRKKVSYLLSQSIDYFNVFIEVVNNAQTHISPSTYEQYNNKIFLFGQPIALTRAMLSLEQMGRTALNQSWDAFKKDVKKNHFRSTDGVENVIFPARIGKHAQLNDGLVGYWIEENTGAVGDFYAPQSNYPFSNPVSIKNLQNANNEDFYLPLSFSGAPIYLTMLIDVRAKIHATTGILPVKDIEIPSSYYTAALSQMEMSFLVAPLLMHKAQTEIPLPIEAGFEWSWLQRSRNDWQEVTENEITEMRTKAVFSGSQKIIEGWLKLKKSDTL